MERGQIVVCRGFMDKPLIRRVWQKKGQTVLIHDETNYSRHMDERAHLEPVGFRISDVYMFDPSVHKDIVEHFERGNILDWSTLKSWEPQKGQEKRGNKPQNS